MGSSLDKFTELFKALKENITEEQNVQEIKQSMILGSQEIIELVP